MRFSQGIKKQLVTELLLHQSKLSQWWTRKEAWQAAYRTCSLSNIIAFEKPKHLCVGRAFWLVLRVQTVGSRWSTEGERLLLDTEQTGVERWPAQCHSHLRSTAGCCLTAVFLTVTDEWAASFSGSCQRWTQTRAPRQRWPAQQHLYCKMIRMHWPLLLHKLQLCSSNVTQSQPLYFPISVNGLCFCLERSIHHSHQQKTKSIMNQKATSLADEDIRFNAYTLSESAFNAALHLDKRVCV